MTDTGLAAALLKVTEMQLQRNIALLGHLLETFVYNELRKQASWHESELTLFHFRDKDQYEVDLIIEDEAGRLAGIEVKTASTLRSGDFKGLRRFKTITGTRFITGVVLYDGGHVLPFGDQFMAVPISALWT